MKQKVLLTQNTIYKADENKLFLIFRAKMNFYLANSAT